MTPYKDIFKALHRAKVRYLVAGGVAGKKGQAHKVRRCVD